MNPTYYSIDESAARSTNNANSFSDHRTGMGGISADNPSAISKLEKKLAQREKSQATMKAVNAYYRKHKTLDRCPDLSPQDIETLKAGMAESYHLENKPFLSWQLSNNNSEIRRLKTRIQSLARHQEATYEGWEFDGGSVEANQEANRLQIFFVEKPDTDTRAILKSNGFHWSPNAGAWQRQLTDNAIRAAMRISCIKPIAGEKSTVDPNMVPF